jgi:Flp pilus assembly protein TadG
MMTQHKSKAHPQRGAVLVLVAVMMAFMLTMVAFAVDVGFMHCAKTDLQRSADAAAIAACWELRKTPSATTPDMTSTEVTNARTQAVSYAGLNKVLNAATSVNSNTSNSTSGDVVVGYLSSPSSPSCAMDTSQLTKDNSVKVTVRRSSAENGTVPLFFAKVLGLSSETMSASATAAILSNFNSFKIPSNSDTIGILPFALDKYTWDTMLAGTVQTGPDGGLGTDLWNYNSSTGAVTSGSDGVHEVNLYPQKSVQSTAPGNRGTVDIGPSGNSTSDIARQIVYGVNQSDLNAIGGALTFDSNGHIFLNGDTGISAGIKDELNSIKGKPRIIPIFDVVAGNGNNAQYEIVAFAGVRITDVKLNGKMNAKHVTIEPADISTLGGSSNGGTTKTYFIYSPVWLVR